MNENTNSILVMLTGAWIVLLLWPKPCAGFADFLGRHAGALPVFYASIRQGFHQYCVLIGIVKVNQHQKFVEETNLHDVLTSPFKPDTRNHEDLGFLVAKEVTVNRTWAQEVADIKPVPMHNFPQQHQKRCLINEMGPFGICTCTLESE